MTERKRYEYIDYTKGLGILLIMFAHVSQYFKPMATANSFVVSFHVPIFFIASGLLMGYRDGMQIDKRQFLIKRAKSLLIPYVIFSLFNSSLKFAVLFLKHSLTADVAKSELVQLCITGNGTVWFLLTLFLTEIIYVFCIRSLFPSSKLVDNDALKMSGGGYAECIVQVILMVACLIVPYLIGKITNPFAIVGNRVIAAMGYYVLGVLIIKLKSAIGDRYTAKIKFLLSVILTVIGVITWVLFGSGVNFFAGSFTNMLGMFSAILLSVACIAWLEILEEISALVYAKKFLNYFGRNSIIVMLVHPTLLLLATYPFGSVFSSMRGIMAIVVSIMLFVVLIVMEVPFIWFINKYIPFVIGKKRIGK